MRFYAADLRKTQAFYSALGINWLGGGAPSEIGPSGLPAEVTPETDRGLPHLWGDLASVEITFYLDAKRVQSSRPPNTILTVYYDGDDDISQIVAELKEHKLYSTDGKLHKVDGGILLDPDGRAIEVLGSPVMRL